ncbi:hypothetical protein [Breoghania sp.]|uniref:sulfotransferase family protein n=1 Tax=Breoghania sp. TaxID=2065378 RepID=UPI002AA6B74A|nr:hypothetical protein [Breoghania sp.]
MPTVALILGMHRSGTSVTARALNLLGYSLPKKLIPADETNETGHWESRPLALFNDKLLATLGSSWDDWRGLTPDALAQICTSENIQNALDLLLKEFGEVSSCVVKDPRICRIAPFWFRVFNEYFEKTSVVIPFRNPIDVAESLLRRNNISFGYGVLMWLRHVLDAERYSRGRDRVFIRYEDIISKKSTIFIDIIDPCVDPHDFELAKNSIDSFVSSRYRHHRNSNEVDYIQRHTNSWVAEVHEILSNWALGGINNNEIDILDKIRDEFYEAECLYRQIC